MQIPAQPPSLALVTGAAHRLGREIALALARRGYAVGVHCHRSVDQAYQTAGEIEALGVPAVVLQADLMDPSEINTLFEQAAALPYPLRALVNSAAVMPRQDLRSVEVGEWDAVFDLNLRAPWLCARAAARIMGERGGVIINISDAGAGRTWTGYPAYVISKSALDALTRLLARALAPAVRVNAVAPGLALKSTMLPEEDWQRLVKRLPLPSSGTAAAVAETVCFLLDNEQITGQTLVVDGGYQLV